MIITGEVITIQVVIKATWINRKKFEIPPKYLRFFPVDALGARGGVDREKYPVQGIPVEFDYGNVKSNCDVATWKNGRTRPRDNSAMGKFLDANRFAAGDVVCITRIAERKYKVFLVKR